MFYTGLFEDQMKGRYFLLFFFNVYSLHLHIFMLLKSGEKMEKLDHFEGEKLKKNALEATDNDIKLTDDEHPENSTEALEIQNRQRGGPSSSPSCGLLSSLRLTLHWHHQSDTVRFKHTTTKKL